MKLSIKIILLLTPLFLLNACKDRIEQTYTINEPVYMSLKDLRSSFKVAEERAIKQSGKIYFKGNYIFVNEYQKGIHLVNNQDPSNPVTEKFIEIPGNVDMAIKGDLLYADSYVDLLTIDISNMDDIKEVDRDTNIFPYIIPFVEDGSIGNIDREKGVIVEYNQVEVTEEVEPNSYAYRTFGPWDSRMVRLEAFNAVGGDKAVTTGTGGSMARFTISGDYLYAVDNSSLKLFNISTLSNPKHEKDILIGWNIETIFPYENKLFIGSQTGMFVYSIQNPTNPEYISKFLHLSACDPVVVEGDYAYVTLRGGNLCGALESQLDVIDISTIESPKLVKEYPMEEPYGLGIKDDVLFVCDGDAGLKIYNAENKLEVNKNQFAKYPTINAFDVIPLDGLLIMIGTDGLYQYDYTDLKNIKQLSHIPIYGKK